MPLSMSTLKIDVHAHDWIRHMVNTERGQPGGILWVQQPSVQGETVHHSPSWAGLIFSNACEHPVEQESNQGWDTCLCPFKRGLIDSDKLGLALWIRSWEKFQAKGIFSFGKTLMLKTADNKNSYVREKKSWWHLFLHITDEKIWLVHTWAKDFKSSKPYNSGCYEMCLIGMLSWCKL